MAQGQEFRQVFSGDDPDYMAIGAQDTAGGTAVEFYWNEVAQKHYCRMHFPGNKLTVWDQPVREKDKRRFAREWDLYQRGLSQDTGQTQLEAWGAIDRGSVGMYREMGIRTVEALANVADVHFRNFPPGHADFAYRHREMACAFLKDKEQSRHFDEAMSAAEQAKIIAEQALSEKAALQEQLEDLQKQIATQSVGAAEEVPFSGDPHDPAPSKPASGLTYPVHAGGPWYLLSDGRKMKGKDAAQRAEREIQNK